MFKNYSIAIFIIAIMFTFVSTSNNADADVIVKRDCSHGWPCSWTIEIKEKARPADGVDVVNGTGEVKGNFLEITIKDKFKKPTNQLVKKMKLAETDLKSVQFAKDYKLKDEVSKELGYESISIAKGDYVIEGNKIKFKIIGSPKLLNKSSVRKSS